MTEGLVAGAEKELSEPRRVVLLEGDTLGRSATESLLRREEYSVVATQHTAAALRLAAASAVDVVLVDLGPGGVEGYAALGPLPDGEVDGRFPVVTLRAAGPSGEASPSGRFAAMALLGRPWDDDVFAEGLQAVFRDGLRPTPPAPKGPRPFESTPAALRTALVVDADEADRRAVADELVRHGFTVHEAGTAAEALRLAVARRPWLVLTELTFPTRTASPSAAACAATACCAAPRSSSSPPATTARRGTRPCGRGPTTSSPSLVPSREMLIRLELLLRRFSEIELGSEPGAGLRGAVELVGAPAVLQICHINQLTGVLVAHRGSQSVRIAFRAGQIVSATGPDHEGPQVVYDFVGLAQRPVRVRPGRGRRGDPDDGRLHGPPPRGLPAARREAPRAAGRRFRGARVRSPSLTRPAALA